MAKKSEPMVEVPVLDWPASEPGSIDPGSIFARRRRVQHPGGGESLTKQSAQEASDVNHIVERWRRSGIVAVTGRQPRYGDFSSVGSYHEAFCRIDEARREFQALPAKVREACRNDPGVFLDKVYSAEGRAELEALGMPKEAAPEAAKPAEPVPPAA